MPEGDLQEKKVFDLQSQIVNKVKAAIAEDQILDGARIVSTGFYDKIGRVVRIDYNGFLGLVPQSEVDIKADIKLEDYLGRLVPFKPIQVGDQNRFFVASIKMAKEIRKTVTWNEVAPNQIRTAKVVYIEDNDNFAVLDIGGITAGLTIKETGPVGKISEMLSDGRDGRKADVIDVKILRCDPAHNRVFVSLWQVVNDPWKDVAKNYALEDQVYGTVVGYLDKVVDGKQRDGVFVQFEDGITALCPVPRRGLPEIGKKLIVIVKRINPTLRHISGKIWRNARSY